MKIAFYKNTEEAKLPHKSYSSDSGINLYTIVTGCIIPPGVTEQLETGICAIIDSGYGLNIETRSSIAQKSVSCIGGIVDNDYRGEIKISLCNHNSNKYVILTDDPEAWELHESFSVHGLTTHNAIIIDTRKPIAQMLVVEVPEVEISEATEEQYLEALKVSKRKHGGFGSTDKVVESDK